MFIHVPTRIMPYKFIRESPYTDKSIMGLIINLALDTWLQSISYLCIPITTLCLIPLKDYQLQWQHQFDEREKIRPCVQFKRTPLPHNLTNQARWIPGEIILILWQPGKERLEKLWQRVNSVESLRRGGGWWLNTRGHPIRVVLIIHTNTINHRHCRNTPSERYHYYYLTARAEFNFIYTPLN